MTLNLKDHMTHIPQGWRITPMNNNQVMCVAPDCLPGAAVLNGQGAIADQLLHALCLALIKSTETVVDPVLPVQQPTDWSAA